MITRGLGVYRRQGAGVTAQSARPVNDSGGCATPCCRKTNASTLAAAAATATQQQD